MLTLDEWSQWSGESSNRAPGQQELIEELLGSVVKAAYNGPCRLYSCALTGATGSGKTHLGYALVDSFPKGTARFVNAIDLHLNTLIGGPEQDLFDLVRGENTFTVIDNARVLFDTANAAGRQEDSKQPSSYTTGPLSLEGRFQCILRDALDSQTRTHSGFIVFIVDSEERIPLALRRPGRIGKSLHVHWSSSRQRHELLSHFLEDCAFEFSSRSERTDCAQILSGQPTSGFTAADIIGLLQQVCTSRRDPSDISVSTSDFLSARHLVAPSSLISRVYKPTAFTALPEIFGLEEEQRTLEHFITVPFKFPRDSKLPRGLLLEGPSGCGKTLLAQSLATLPICTTASSEIRGSPITFIAVDATQVLSKYFGQSSRNLARIFQEARQAAPCILFFDQIDSLVGKRGGDETDDHSNRLVTTFLVEMDGIVAKRAADSGGEDVKQIIVVGATRAKHLIDPAMLRPGRLELHIRVPLPDPRARDAYLRGFCARSPSFKLDDDNLRELVEATESWSMAELESLCGEAVLLALRNNLDAEEVCISHFREILAKK